MSTGISFSFGKAFVLACLLATAPLAAHAEGTDLQDGSRGNISETQGSVSGVIHTGHDGGSVTIAKPGAEGVDLESGSRGEITQPRGGGWDNKAVGNGKAVPQQSPDAEGVDLQKGARSTIE